MKQQLDALLHGAEQHDCPIVLLLYVDAPLQNLTIAYMQERAKYSALSIFPKVPVVKQSDRYYIFDKAALLRIDAKKRAAGTVAVRSGFTLSTDTYRLDRDALGWAISDPERRFADSPLDLERAAADYLATQMLASLTANWAATFFVTGVWGTSATLSLKWHDPNSDPLADVQTATRTIAQNTTIGLVAQDLLVEQAGVECRVVYHEWATQACAESDFRFFAQPDFGAGYFGGVARYEVV